MRKGILIFETNFVTEELLLNYCIIKNLCSGSAKNMRPV